MCISAHIVGVVLAFYKPSGNLEVQQRNLPCYEISRNCDDNSNADAHYILKLIPC